MSAKDTREIAVFSVVVTLSVIVMWFLRPSAPTEVILVPVPVPRDQELHPGAGLFDVSRDGSLLVYRRQGTDGGSELWARAFAEDDASPIRGTDDAGLPAISPDGREVAFTTVRAPGRIRVTSLIGGTTRTIADSAGIGGVRWSPDGAWIYYTDGASGLSRVRAEGGPPEVLTRTEPGGRHWGVEVLPGGAAIAYTADASGERDSMIEVLSLETGEVKAVWPGSFPRYSETGHLLFMDASGSSLVKAPFDPVSLDLRRMPEPITTDLAHPGGWPLFSLSQTGTLVYARPVGGETVTPVWVARDGTSVEIDPAWRHRAHRTYSSVALSPDDDRLAVSIPSEEGSWEVWVKSLTLDAPLARLTSEGAFNYRPTWSPDGETLTFISDRAGQADLWATAADGSGVATRILDRPGVIRNGSVSPDGAWLIFREGEAPVADIFAVRADSGVDSGGEASPVVVTEAGERSPVMSPNGEWVAYTSLASGEWQVWVTAFLGEERWPVSLDGGEEPVWAHSGRELFYRNRANELVSVRVREEPAFELGPREVLFSMDHYLGSDGRAQYAVSADDQRFLMLRLTHGGDVELLRVDDAFTGSEEPVPGTGGVSPPR